MDLTRRLGGPSGALFLLCTACGFVGLDDAALDAAGVGGGLGDGDVGDGDVGDGDVGDGDASGGLGGLGGGSEAGGSSNGDGGANASGGTSGAGGLVGGGGLFGVGGFPGTGGAAWGPILFHDYEDATVPGEENSSDNASLTIVKDFAYKGVYSLKASQPEGTNGTATLTFDLPDGTYPKLYLRAFLYVETGTLSGAVTLFSFRSLDGGGSLSLGVDTEGLLFAMLPDEGMTRHNSVTGSYVTGEWFCFQAEAVFDDVEGTIKLLTDSTERLTSVKGDTRPGEGVVSFSYGILSSDTESGGAAILFDNVTLDDQPIGCDALPPNPVDPVEN